MNCFRAVCAALGLAGLLAFAAGCDNKTPFLCKAATKSSASTPPSSPPAPTNKGPSPPLLPLSTPAPRAFFIPPQL